MTDRHPRQDTLLTDDLARIPQPGGRGAGSHELATESDDPAVLRQVIEQARERLAFYESFDRIIGENIRRSGELMLETIALREEAKAAEDARIARETAIERERQSEREATRTLLAALRDDVSAFQASTAVLAERIEDALKAFEQRPVGATPSAVPPTLHQADDAAVAKEPSPESSASPATPVLASAATDSESAVSLSPTQPTGFRPIRHATPKPSASAHPPIPETPAEETTPHRMIDLIVNGISRATTALAFQRELGRQSGVIRVETREFAEGVLRLNVEVASDDAVSDETFAAWGGPGTIRVITRQPTLIALDLTEV